MTDILLTYHSSTIRRNDLLCLNPQNWLNDQIINFYFEYLSHEYLTEVRNHLFSCSLI